MHFKSSEEAYTHMLMKFRDVQESMEDTQLQMGYLFENIRKRSFHVPADKAIPLGDSSQPVQTAGNKNSHEQAMKELGYLIKQSQEVFSGAKEFNEMAQKLFEDLTGGNNNEH